MPTSLPPLPEDMGKRGSPPPDPSSGSDPNASAFSGGAPPAMAAVQQIEDGFKKLVSAQPSLVPLVAQWLSQLRMATGNSMQGAGAGADPSGGPGAPPISGMGQNPTALPAPPPQGPPQ